MKFTATALTLSLSFAGARAESKIPEIRSRRHLSRSFIEAMNEPQIEAARKKGRAEKIRKLQQDLMHASRKLDQYNQQYNQQYEEDVNEIPFDMTARSFKYAGCAAIKTYDEERAEENGNPMVMDTYAVFRLCPADSCNAYSASGCGSNYGEYAIEMKTYLSYVLDYYDNRYEEYCEFCLPCDYQVQAESKAYLQQCYNMQAQQDWQDQQQMQQQAYEDYYSANGNYQSNNANNYNNGNSVYNNGNGFNNYNQYYNGAKNNGNRQMQNNYGNGQYYANGGNYGNGEQVNQQNAQAYGYFNEDGEWVNGQGGAEYQAGYWGQDGNYYPYDGAAAGMDYKCADGSMCDLCTWQTEQEYGVCDDYVCKSYYTYCSDLYTTDEENDFDARDYLECQPYDNEYGQRYYIGPHCGSNHFTVSLGVFSDENCVNYIGESVSLSSVLGFQYTDSDIFQLPKACISCDGTEEYEDDANKNGQGRYGDYVSAPETDEDGVVAMCSALYQGSAQCNMNMKNFQQIAVYMSTYELDLESRYCAFIKNIIAGSYDESGEIKLQSEEFNLADWKQLSHYKKLQLPASQAILLAASIIVCVAMAAAAAFTARTLSRQSTPWKPKRVTDASGLSRQNSGIVMGRSRSGPGAAPLI